MRPLNSNRRNSSLVGVALFLLPWSRAFGAPAVVAQVVSQRAPAKDNKAEPPVAADPVPTEVSTSTASATPEVPLATRLQDTSTTASNKPEPEVQATVAAPAPSTKPAATALPGQSANTPMTVGTPRSQPLPPEAPLAAYFEVGVVVQMNWNNAAAFDYFSANDVLTKAGLVVGVDLAAFGGTALGLDVNVLFAQTDDEGPLPAYVHNGKLDETDLGGGLTVRHQVFGWLAPQLRVGGGVALQEAVLSGSDFSNLRQDVTTGYLTLGGGFAFSTPGRRLSRTRTYLNSLGARLIFEGGYHLGQELEFVVPGKSPTDGNVPNAIAETRVGVLPQSGAYLRVTAEARF
jgi:hypothetical protein